MNGHRTALMLYPEDPAAVFGYVSTLWRYNVQPDVIIAAYPMVPLAMMLAMEWALNPVSRDVIHDAARRQVPVLPRTVVPSTKESIFGLRAEEVEVDHSTPGESSLTGRRRFGDFSIPFFREPVFAEMMNLDRAARSHLASLVPVGLVREPVIDDGAPAIAADGPVVNGPVQIKRSWFRRCAYEQAEAFYEHLLTRFVRQVGLDAGEVGLGRAFAGCYRTGNSDSAGQSIPELIIVGSSWKGGNRPAPYRFAWMPESYGRAYARNALHHESGEHRTVADLTDRSALMASPDCDRHAIEALVAASIANPGEIENSLLPDVSFSSWWETYDLHWEAILANVSYPLPPLFMRRELRDPRAGAESRAKAQRSEAILRLVRKYHRDALELLIRDSHLHDARRGDMLRKIDEVVYVEGLDRPSRESAQLKSSIASSRNGGNEMSKAQALASHETGKCIQDLPEELRDMLGVRLPQGVYSPARTAILYISCGRYKHTTGTKPAENEASWQIMSDLIRDNRPDVDKRFHELQSTSPDRLRYTTCWDEDVECCYIEEKLLQAADYAGRDGGLIVILQGHGCEFDDDSEKSDTKRKRSCMATFGLPRPTLKAALNDVCHRDAIHPRLLQRWFNAPPVNQVKHIVVVLDHCRSHFLRHIWTEGTTIPSQGARLVITSAGNDQDPLDGLFLLELVKHMVQARQFPLAFEKTLHGWKRTDFIPQMHPAHCGRSFTF